MRRGLNQETHRLLDVLHEAATRATTERLTIAQFLDRLGPSSLGVICLFLSLPFLPPIAMGPLSIAGGLTFAALGWQMRRGEVTAQLPDRLTRIAPGPRSWRTLAYLLNGVVSVCRRFSRQRLVHWIDGHANHRRVGLLVVLGGLLMAIPFVGVPLNNTFPAFAIAFAVLAQLFRDGVLLIVSILFLKISVIYFAIVIWVVAWAGSEALARYADWIPFL